MDTRLDTKSATILDFHPSTLNMVKGKYYVYVTVPKRLEHLFTQKQIRRSTGTSDRKLAERKQHAIAQEIYKRFDAEEGKEASRKAFEEHLAKKNKEERYYDILQTLVNTSVEALSDGSGEVRPHNVRHEFRFDTPWRSQLLCLIEAVVDEAAWGATPMLGTFDKKYEHVRSAADEYLQPDFQRFVEQFREPEDPSTLGFADDSGLDDTEQETAQESQLSNLLASYMLAKKWDSRKIKSKTTAERQIKAFIRSSGNPCVTEVKKSMAYDLARELEAEGKSNSLIRSTISAASAMLTWCELEGTIDANPLVHLNLSDFGTKTKHYRPFEPAQLHSLFAMKMPEQERLLLEILVTTGMRLDEAALLTWDQVKERNGIRYFDLSDAIVKNKASARLVALPDCLTLPPQGTGRLFDYTLDADGKASNRASRVLGGLIKKVPNKHKSQVLHSLRGTLKDLLRDAGVSKETNDYITGHSGSDVASTYGSGPSLKVRYEAVNKVRHPWLTSKIGN
ncbi:putative phage integrase [Ruegeria sp. TrichCH4B]|nr:putative phage integrase [Ruegeria sp. TrichCH4B]